MKRALYIVILIIGMVGLSSCRSTSSSCGLAENSTNQSNFQQIQLV